MTFVHLHTHTEYSMLDGASRVDDVVAAVAADGQPAVGITDHGNMYGVLEFYRAARAAGITPVLGIEAYQAAESRFERPARNGVDGDKLYFHLTLLAETTAGYRNLIKLSSAAYLEGYWIKPRVDWELLERHHDGVIATTGCLGGIVNQALLRGDEAAALALAGRLQDVFGKDNLFVELQDHGLAAQRQTNPLLVDIARRLGAPLLATNDSHYTHREDHIAHDALLCVQTGATIDDPKRFKFETDQHWVKTAAEMRHLFKDWPDACDNTLRIAERASVEIEFGKPELPRFPLPEGFATDDAYLRHLTMEGARERYGDPVPAEVAARLERELDVIVDMGLSCYFLIVWDLIRHARERGIRVGPGRGSSAGCCAAYCLRIVDLDPIRYGLLFERFLNAGRREMPDIDMDFDERYRGEMIRYAAEKYGSDHVAQIVTFSTIKARAAVRDGSRVLGYPYAVGDRIAKLMPPLVMGRDTPLRACLDLTPGYEDGYKVASDLRALYESDPEAKKVIDVARGLEGLRRQDGIHAAAVVITREPLTEYLPIQRKPEPGGDPASAPVVTQYEMHGVADLGLLKMDFLGLRNLSTIERALDLIEGSTGARPDIDNVPLDDEKVFEMLRAGDSIGVFQLEGGPMRALMRSLAPTCFDDIGALVALYRPGPMAANMHNDFADRKNNRKPVSYLHPDAEEVLRNTHGLCLAGDTVVHDLRDGRPRRLDELGPLDGFQVQGVDHDLNPVAAAVTHWVCNGERETIELQLQNGMALTGTAEHPVLTFDGWKALGSLGADDVVAVPKALLPPISPLRLDRDRLRALAASLADGAGPAGAAVERREAGRLESEKEKVVPEVVFRLANDDVACFLAALWDRLGHTHAGRAHYPTASKAMAEQVRVLLMRLGLGTQVLEGACPSCAAGGDPFVCPVAADDGARLRALLSPHLATAMAGGPAGARRHAAPAQRRFEAHGLDDLVRLTNVDWVGVRALRRGGTQLVYDLTVEGVHNFVANGMVVHNCIYQEEVMRVAQKFAGYSLQEADNLRKACSKKVRSLMAKEREKFVAGCVATGYGEQLGNQWFDIIEPFADYAFPKAHAYCYGKVAYQTAWLKANHPVEYLAALLTSVKDDKDKTAVYLAECRNRRIAVTVPDVNRSAAEFTAVNGEIVFGMASVRNVGEGLVGLIVAEREANGPYADFYDFCSRVDPVVLNKRSIESLIKAGGFDSLGHPRQGLLHAYERIIDGTLARRREQELGIMSLFGDGPADGPGPVHDERVPIDDVEFDDARKLAFEKEMLGLYVSSHPLLGVGAALRRLTEASIAELRECRDGETKWVGGVVTALQRKYTKRGDLMAVFTLEDLEAAIEVMVFPRTMLEYGALLSDDAVVCVKGRLDLKEEPAKIVCLEIRRPDLADGDDPPLRIKLAPGSLTDTVVGRLKSMLQEHPGDTPVFLHLEKTVLRLPDAFRVDTRNGLFAELRVLLGPNGLVV